MYIMFHLRFFMMQNYCHYITRGLNTCYNRVTISGGSKGEVNPPYCHLLNIVNHIKIKKELFS